MSAGNVEFLVRLRDALQMAADACEEYLQKLTPKEIKTAWNPNRISWIEANGPSGAYQKASEENNKDNFDFKLLLQDLDEHDGRLTRNHWFYWKFSKNNTVGRKKRL